MSRFVRGFTLLEMLVVLVIAGFVTTILFEALSNVYRLHHRFGLELARGQVGEMHADWFRQVVQGLQPDFADGKAKFQGEGRYFSGLSTGSLSADYGALAEIKMELDFDPGRNESRLRFAANSAPARALVAWPGRLGSRFVYLDAKGGAHEQWPPRSGQMPQLPSAILFKEETEAYSRVLVAVPRSSLENRPRPLSLAGQTP